jgi:hypothetical protein
LYAEVALPLQELMSASQQQLLLPLPLILLLCQHLHCCWLLLYCRVQL